MSEESRSLKFGPPRQLRDGEIALVSALLKAAGDTGTMLNTLGSLWVQEMPDGGMGSLYFVSATKAPAQRKYGRRIAEMQFNDTDGIAILASLNLDEDGDLYELDVWKTDYSPTLRLDPTAPIEGG